jgi:8-oxo-dGTP pyrophosphatase MutT (NUDIX family)
MDKEVFISQLKQELAKELPGENAQNLMAPKLRKQQVDLMLSKGAPKQSSVLLLLYPLNQDLHIVFTQRHQYKGIHSGQVSFPGGKREKEDQSFWDTALREAEEEMNIPPKEVQQLGKLSELFVPPSQFNIHPFVGYLSFRPNFKQQESEVKSYFEVALSTLLNKDVREQKEIEMANGIKLDTPYFHLCGYTVWGATAMILSEFIAIVRNTSIFEKK